MKAIIAAWWYGTRMLPLTKSVPKELLPVGNKPVIQYIVESIVKNNIKDIIIITSQGKQALEDYFDKNFELEELLKSKGKHELLDMINKPKHMANYCFVKQKQQLGFAHAVLEARQWVNDEYFLLTVWDTVFDDEVFTDVMSMHWQTHKPVIWLKEVPDEEISKYWAVDIKDWIIKKITEKPPVHQAPSNKIIIWVYVLPIQIFDIITSIPVDSKHGEILLTDAFNVLATQMDVMGAVTKGSVRDVGTPEWWLRANNEFFG